MSPIWQYWDRPCRLIETWDVLKSNKELTEGYKITEIGVYGKEVGSEEDFLCSIAVTRSMEETDSFPPYNGLRECQIIQDYYITISPDAEVTVNTQGAAALAEDLEALRQEIGEKLEEALNGKTNIVITHEDIPLSQRKRLIETWDVLKFEYFVPEEGTKTINRNMRCIEMVN